MRQTPANSGNELDLISAALERTMQQIAGLIGGVAQTASAVKHAAFALRSGSDSIVHSTSAQSEAAAGLAAAIEELSVSITHVSDNAALALDITQGAQACAEEGGGQVRTMISGMERISGEIDNAGVAVNLLSERSAKISNIGKIINEIADQTNLLALNAAIEAARAGESGRGFAVVADEVRKLAEQARTASTQIGQIAKDLHVTSQDAAEAVAATGQTVDSGLSVADRAQAAMAEVQSGAKRRVEVVTQGLVFTGDDNPMNKMLLTMLGAVAEFELASRDPARECVSQSMIGMMHMERGNIDQAIDAAH